MSVCNLLVAASPAFIQQESAAVFPLFWKQHSVNAQTAVGFLIRNPSRKNLLPLGMGGSLPFIKSCWHVSVSLWLLFPPLSPIIERETVCKLQTQKRKERNDMQCSPPTSKNTLSQPLRKYWTPYAELQRRKADGRQGLQGQRRASGACGMGWWTWTLKRVQIGICGGALCY